GWVEFTSVQDKFKGYFPVKPTYKKQGMAMYEGEDKQKDISGAVMVQDLPPNVPPDQIAQIKKSVINLMVGAVPGGKKLSERETTLAGQPATEVVMEVTMAPFGKKGADGQKGQGILRLITTGGKLYIVALTKDKGAPSAEEINGFFDNFELTK